MATLTNSSAATSSSATEGDVKNYLSSVYAFLADLLGTDSTNKVAALQKLGAVLNGSVVKTGAYTVAASDRGKVIECSGTWTLSVTAVATLSDGFVFAVVNTGSGTITLDPNLSELIDGAAAKTLTPGQFALVYCDGSALYSIGGGGVTSFNGRSGAVTLQQADITSALVTGALGYSPVSKDSGYNGVGSFCLVIPNGIYLNALGYGAAYSGSYLISAYLDSSLIIRSVSNLSGTWRITGGGSSSYGYFTLAQRIA